MPSVIPIGNKWRAQVRLAGHKTQTKTFSKKSLAERWGADTEYALERLGLGILPREILCKQLFLTYDDEVKPLKPFGRNKAAVLKTLSWHLGDEPAADLTAQRVVRYITKDRKVRGVTAAIDLTYLEGVLRYAKVVSKLPVHVEAVQEARDMLNHLGLLGRSTERDRRPTQPEIDQLKSWFAEHSVSLTPDLLDFIVDSAFRPPSEIERLRWEDLNEKDRTILIRDRKDPRKKIGNNQIVPLLGRCMDIILKQPRKDDEGNPREFIFDFTGGTWSSIFPRACRACGIKDLRLYDLRHEAISRLVESRKYSIPEIMLVSGHKDPKQMMRYTQLRAVDLHDR